MARRSSPTLRRRKSASPGTAEVELIKMSELATRSGVPAPTIKHYIREGLLNGPEIRTSRNMAYYDARVAGRIRVIKRLQAERFLPLRMIAALLEAAPSAQIRPECDAEQRRALTALTPIVNQGTGTRRRKRSEVMKMTGVTRGELDRLERAGVLELRGSGAAAGYGGGDLAVLDVLAKVRALGLAEVFPTSIAEPYLAAVRQLVDVEIDVFRHRVLSAGLPHVSISEIVPSSVELGAQLIIALRAKLLPRLLAALAKPA